MKKHQHALLAVVCVLWLAFFLPFAFAALTGSASQDWPMFRHDPGHTGHTTAAGPTTPNVLWNFSTSGNGVNSSPAVVDDRLYVGSENGNIYCLNAQTGQQIWVNFKITTSFRSSPAVSNGFLYICDARDVVYCLDAQTGKINWTFSRDDGVLADAKSSSPTVVNGYVYICSGSNSLFCLDALTGREVWALNIVSMEPSLEGTGWPEIGYSSVSTSPAIIDDRIYVGGSNLHCIDANSGGLIWSYPVVVGCAPAVSEGKVYFSSWEGNAYCLNADTGEKVWNQSGIMGWSRSGPSVADGRVYFGGLIYCLDASSGEVIWRYSTGDIQAASSPIVAGEYAYFCARGFTYCVNATTGEDFWKSKPSFDSSLAVVDGVLYVGSGDSIVAFGDSSSFPLSLLVMGFTVVSICTVIGLAYVANREGKAASAKWKKVFTAPVTVALILVILASSFASLYITRSTPSPAEPTSPEFPPASSLLWQIGIEHFATSIAAGDGKVFITTKQGTFAYSTQDGELIWSTEDQEYRVYDGQFTWITGDQGQSGAQVFEGSVYAGSAASMVFRLNETNGKVITYYPAPATSSFAVKGQAGFILGDGKVFALNEGIAVYDMDSGGLYWQIRFTGAGSVYTLGELGTSETDRLGYVYVFGGSRLDVNNGETLWDAGGWADGNLVVDDRVILWNFRSNVDQPFMIRCVDALAGQTLWDFETGIPVYKEPVVYGGLLLFGTPDGYLYALNLDDGSLAWKTLVDVDGWMGGNNLPAEAKSLSDPSASSIVVDNETGLGFWGFLVTQRQIEGVNGDNLYVGRFCSFDLSTGNISRTTVVQTGCTVNDNGVALALGEDEFS